MRLTVSETAKLTNISVRTLHYYDEIGLLKPAHTSEAGYRYYDDEALAMLQQILLYRELDFPLKEIRDMLSRPDYDSQAALKAHKELLLLKIERLTRMAGLVDRMMRGENDMSFQEFDEKKIEAAKEQYAREVKERWGNTEAYRESSSRTSGYGEKEWKAITKEMNDIFREFAECVGSGEAPEGSRAAELTERWRRHITENYYECTLEILSGLGKMYAADGRFKENIDQFGANTAEFMSRAIACYCWEKLEKEA